jgi:transposase-like protein
MDDQTGLVLAAEYTVRENYQTAYKLFKQLDNSGVKPLAITIDGLPCVLRAIKDVWPEVVIQRCLVHIQRQGLSWLRRRPLSLAGQKLRKLLLDTTSLATYDDKQRFLKQWRQWRRSFDNYLLTLDPKHKVYSDLQRTRSLIQHALPNMFHYLDNPLISPSTNRIESYFSRLKSIIKRHSGLSKNNRENYLRWYVSLKNSNT